MPLFKCFTILKSTQTSIRLNFDHVKICCSVCIMNRKLKSGKTALGSLNSVILHRYATYLENIQKEIRFE